MDGGVLSTIQCTTGGGETDCKQQTEVGQVIVTVRCPISVTLNVSNIPKTVKKLLTILTTF